MNIYRLSDRLRVFAILFSFLLIGAFGSLLFVPFITLPANSRVLQFYTFCYSLPYLYYLILFLILVGITIGAILLINVFRRKVIFAGDSIISKDIFNTHSLAFSEIRGFIIKRSIVYIITNSKNKRRITINLMSLDRSDNLVRNLEMRFSNLG
jgi:hypothetical protein